MMLPLPSALTHVDGSNWSRIDFISDLHLQASHPANLKALRRYVAQLDTDALFILGDLFEVWVGDDIVHAPEGAFEAECLDLLRVASARCPVHFMAGNRDFLLGPQALARGGLRGLNDPTVLQTRHGRLLLSHGDALCLDDHAYLAFRQQVRSANWQQDFLALPLTDRLQRAQAMRAQSQAHQQQLTHYADVDTTAALHWLHSTQAHTLVHGHTHRPQAQRWQADAQRQVLPDWEVTAQPPRGYVLRWQNGDWVNVALSPGAATP